LNHFLNEELNKIKTEKCIGILGHSWCCWKALGESDLIGFISQFSELSCGKTLFLSGFLLLDIQKKLQKLGLEGKFSSHCQI